MMFDVLLIVAFIFLGLLWVDLFLIEVRLVRRFRGWIAAAATLLLIVSRLDNREKDDEESRTFGPSVDLPDPQERFDHKGTVDEVDVERARPISKPVDVDPDDDLGDFRAAAERDGILSGDED